MTKNSGLSKILEVFEMMTIDLPSIDGKGMPIPVWLVLLF
jgi:hypothetical protein